MTDLHQPTVEACWACGAPSAATDEFLPARYQRCPDCGLVFQPERHADELRELYDEEYFSDCAGGDDYAADDAQRRHEAKVRIRRLRGLAPAGRLLEIGAASGHFLAAARQAGYDAVGIE